MITFLAGVGFIACLGILIFVIVAVSIYSPEAALFVAFIIAMLLMLRASLRAPRKNRPDHKTPMGE